MKTITYCLVGLLAFAIQNQALAQGLIDSLYVPVDHFEPGSEKFYLKYELGAPYKSNLPTVFAIADGQQFWARSGRAQKFQREIFGDSLNVVVIFSRALNDDIISQIKNKKGETNWIKAYEAFNFNQWIEDIEAVRMAILPNEKINLYGRSGGGLLLLQYLEKYHKNVDKAFCQTAILPEIEHLLGFRHDKLWEEISNYDEQAAFDLKKAIKMTSINYDDIVLAFQRQNFFIPSSEINEQRKHLIDIIVNNRTNEFDSLLEQYQVHAVKKMLSTGPGISSAVRQYEFFMLENLDKLIENEEFRPNMEALKIYAQPLLDLFNKNKISRPSSDFSVFHEMKTQVFIFAGRWDHTVDYRGQFYLSGLIPNDIFFLADDNHVFSEIYETDNYKKIVSHALLYERSSEEMQNLLEETTPLRWNEWKKNKLFE